MLTVKYPEAWNLDVFFEGRSKLPVFQRFLKALSIKVQHVVAQVQKLTIEESRAVPARWPEIRHASSMLSCSTAQNTKDTKAKEQGTAMIIVEDLAMKYLGEDITKRQFWEKGIKLCVRDGETFIQLVSKEG